MCFTPVNMFRMKMKGDSNKAHLDRPVSVRLSDAQVDESGHRQAHVEPVAEAEVVDELENVLHTQKDESHQALQPHGTKRRYHTVPAGAHKQADAGLCWRLLTLNSRAGTGV